jgi:hypothetical protein
MHPFLRNLIAVGTILSATLTFAPKTQALTEEEVFQKLESVPLFVLGNNNGEFRNSFFFNPKQAEEQLALLQQQVNDTETQSLEVMPLSLRRFFEIITEAHANNPELPPPFMVADEKERLAAQQIIQAQTPGQDVSEIGIPLFFVAYTNEDNGNISFPVFSETISRNPIVPFYMQKSDADNLVSLYRQNQVSLFGNNTAAKDTVKVQVISMPDLLSNMSEKDGIFEFVEIVPSDASVQEYRSMILEQLQASQPNR